MCIASKENQTEGVEKLIESGFHAIAIFSMVQERPIFYCEATAGTNGFATSIYYEDHGISSWWKRFQKDPKALILPPGQVQDVCPNWAKLAEDGPIAVVPLLQNKQVLGIVVVFSTPTHPITEPDLYAIECLSREISKSVYHQRLIQDIQRAQKITDFLGIFPYQTRSHDQDSAYLQKLLNKLRSVLEIKTCGIYLPFEDTLSQEFWSLVYQSGFPDVVAKRSVYKRGEGLTGLTLTIAHSDVVISDDVEADVRWSHKHGPLVLRQPTTNGPVAFIGIPLFLPQNDSLAYGALVCTRSRQSRADRAFFSKYEEKFLKFIAHHISRIVQSIKQREDSIRRLRSHVDISRVYCLEDSETDIYKETLACMQREFDFERLLLAVINRNKTVIKGKAVLNFPEGLVADTNRILLKVPPVYPKDEDILSYICREQIKEPLIVDPTDTTDINVVHLHDPTESKYKMHNPIMFIPLVSPRGGIRGVIHAEFAEQRMAFTSEERDHLCLYASQLATLIDLRDAAIDAKHGCELYEAMLKSLQTGSSKNTLRVLLKELSVYGCDAGLVLIYDEQKRCLTCVLSHNMKEAVDGLTFFVDPSDRNRIKKPKSLAEAVFLRNEPILVPDVSKQPFNQTGRVLAGLESGTPALGLPLKVGSAFLGVLIAYSNSSPSPIGMLEIERFTRFSRMGALALMVAQTQEAAIQYANEQEMSSEIMKEIGLIASHSELNLDPHLGQMSKHLRLHLNKVISSSASLLKAELTALYLADYPVCVYSRSNSENVDKEWKIGDRKFILRAKKGYPDSLLDKDFYTPARKALTSSVLRKLCSQKTQDVQMDPQWSSKHRYIFKGRFSKSQGLRSWMGVPLIAQEDDRKFLLGVLTFTRPRNNRKDALFFADRDVHMAENLANMLTLALRSRLTSTRLRKEESRQLAVRFADSTICSSRNIIAGLLAHIELLRQELSCHCSISLDDRIEKISHALGQLSRLYDSAKDAIHEPTISREPIILIDYFNDFVQSITPYATEKSIKVETHLPKGICTLSFDGGLFRRILHILFKSSTEAMFYGGTFSINVELQKKLVTFRIKNKGRLFEAGKSVSYLGLIGKHESFEDLDGAFIRSVVHAHGGSIEMDNSSEEGSELCIYLPRE